MFVFVLSFIRTMPRVGSDHVPIVFNTDQDNKPRKKVFRSEKWWLKKRILLM